MDYAFLIMGPYDPARDDVRFPGRVSTTRMIGVPDISTAEKIAARLKGEGYKAIELCGAFGEDGAKRIIEATGHSIAIGFVMHLPEDDELFRKTFG